jgi:hypothetical protein
VRRHVLRINGTDERVIEAPGAWANLSSRGLVAGQLRADDQGRVLSHGRRKDIAAERPRRARRETADELLRPVLSDATLANLLTCRAVRILLRQGLTSVGFATAHSTSYSAGP